MPQVSDLKLKLVAYAVTWVNQPDPAGLLDQGYFERVVNGRKIGCPVSVRKGQPLNPRMVRLIYRRLDIADDPFPLN